MLFVFIFFRLPIFFAKIVV